LITIHTLIEALKVSLANKHPVQEKTFRVFFSGMACTVGKVFLNFTTTKFSFFLDKPGKS
jgi:hypothetical protein